MGKGSTRRPAQVPNAVVEANWERIFGEPRKKFSELRDQASPERQERVRERVRELTQEMEKKEEYDDPRSCRLDGCDCGECDA